MSCQRGRALGFIFVVAAACTPPAFTAGVRDRYALSPQDLQHVQFFTSEEIRLERDVREMTRSIEQNALSIHQGERFEQVIIPAGTAGVALRVEGDYVLVGFSHRDLDEALWFALERAGEVLATAPERKYQLVMLENPRGEVVPFAPRYSPGFLVPWAGNRFRVSAGKTAFLRYDFDESLERRRVENRPPGWRLSEGSPPMTPPPRTMPADAGSTPLAPSPSASEADAGAPEP